MSPNGTPNSWCRFLSCTLPVICRISDRSVQMFEQRGPASGTRIPGRHDRDRPRPLAREVRIVVGDTEVLGRFVWPVDPVAHVRGIGQRLEAVEKALRHIEMSEVLVVQEKCLTVAKTRRF